MFEKFSSVVFHKAGVFLLFYPTPEKNLLHCIPPCRRFCSVVGYNEEKMIKHRMIF
jgi:hypothetical protein